MRISRILYLNKRNNHDFNNRLISSSETYVRILPVNSDKVNSKTSFAFLTCCWRSCYDMANHKTKFANIDESCKNICNKRPCSIRLCNCLHYAKDFGSNLGKPKIKKLRPSKFDKYKTKKWIFREKLILWNHLYSILIVELYIASHLRLSL